MSVYLLYTGIQDLFLTENPNFTYFQSVLVRDTQHITQGFEIPFDNTSGQSLICTLPKNGDFIDTVTFKVSVPPLTIPLINQWTFDISNLSGSMYGFDSNNNQVFTLTINGNLATTTFPLTWVSNTNVTVGYTNPNIFTFTCTSTVQYVCFDSEALAAFWGFVYNPVQLYGGRLKFYIYGLKSFQAQTFWQDSGWILGIPAVQSTQTAYTIHVIEDLIETVSLVIGGQEIQTFDPFFIRYLKESSYSYKNRPIMDLLENGDTSVVNSTRIFYYEIPFMKYIPLHALDRQDVKVVIRTTNFFSGFQYSLIVQYDTFQNVKLPDTYSIDFKQVSYFSGNSIHARGPLTRLVTNAFSIPFQLSLNGEQFCDSEYTEISSLENDFNVPFSSNTCAINGTLISSRFRDQLAVPGVYAETINTLLIQNGISGLVRDMTQTSQWRPNNYFSKSPISYPLFSLVALDSQGNQLQFLVKSNTTRGTFSYLGAYYSYDSSLTDPNLVTATFNINANNYAYQVVFSSLLQECTFTRDVQWNNRGILVYPLYSLTGDDGSTFSLNSTSSSVTTDQGTPTIISYTLTNGYVTSFVYSSGTVNLIDSPWTSYAGLPAPVSVYNLSITSVYDSVSPIKYYFSPESGTVTGRFGLPVGNGYSYNYSYVGTTIYINNDSTKTVQGGFSIQGNTLTFYDQNHNLITCTADSGVTTPLYLFIE